MNPCAAKGLPDPQHLDSKGAEILPLAVIPWTIVLGGAPLEFQWALPQVVLGESRDRICTDGLGRSPLGGWVKPVVNRQGQGAVGSNPAIPTISLHSKPSACISSS